MNRWRRTALGDHGRQRLPRVGEVSLGASDCAPRRDLAVAQAAPCSVSRRRSAWVGGCWLERAARHAGHKGRRKGRLPGQTRDHQCSFKTRMSVIVPTRRMTMRRMWVDAMTDNATRKEALLPNFKVDTLATVSRDTS